jgi:glycosyltransferase involved in cell wall biosynthesis
VVIPAFRYDASDLIDQLARCQSSQLAEIIVYDDGSCDHDLLARMEATAGRVRAAVRIVSSPRNRGRAAARNHAIAHARADWILLVDADMAPDSDRFLEIYLSAVERVGEPSVIVGGCSLRFAPTASLLALHRWQSRASECVSAVKRRRAPGRFVFTANVLAHREVFQACPFDEGFSGWGWEDTDWGLTIEAKFPIMHIENTATHLGLESAKTLMGKYVRSGGNFARLIERHPEAANAMPLYRAAKRAQRLPYRKLLRALAGGVAASHWLPTALRGRALKAWRALVYADAIR